MADLNDFATAVGALINNARWSRGVLGPNNEHKHADDAPDGVVSVWNATGALAVGLPTPDLGTVFTVRFGNAGRQIWRTLSNTTYERSRDGGVWGGWVRTDAGDSAPKGHDHDDRYQMKGTGIASERERPGSGTKVVPLSLTLGQPTASAPVSATYRVPQRWNAPITRWRLCATNRSVRRGDPVGTGIQVDGMWVGEHAGNGAFTTTPIRAVGPFTVPDDGSVYRSGWLNTPVGDRRDMLFSYQYTATTGPVLQVAGAYTTTAKVAGDTAPTGLSLGKTAALDLWIEAETYADTPVVAVLGDSLSSGAQATLPCYDSAVSIYARNVGALPVHYAASSDTLSDWVADPSEYKVTRWDHLASADVCLIAMGHNDIYGLGHTAAQVRADFATALAMVKDHVAPHAVVSTITPRNAGTAEQHAIRRDHNSWLSGQVGAGSVRDLFDFDLVITGGTDAILPAYNADGIHFNTAGYTAQAASITRPLTSPASQQADLSARLAALTYDSGVRNVSGYLATGWTGTVYARRKDDRIEYKFRNLVRGAGAGGTAMNTIPGFVPTASEQSPYGFIGVGGTAETPAQMYRVSATQYGFTIVSPPGVTLNGDFVFTTSRATPTTPPGSAA